MKTNQYSWGWLTAAALLLSVLPAQPMTAGESDPEVLPMWEVGLSNFDADKPELLVLPSKTGKQLQFWVWRYRFNPVTNLRQAKKFLGKAAAQASGTDILGPGTSEKAFYQRYLQRVEKSLEQEHLPQVYIALHADNGEILTDTSNPAVRNYLERKENIRDVYTTAELRQTKLTAMTVDPKSKMVEAVAIFPRVSPEADLIEVRVTGMGQRIRPTFEPGDLLYTENEYNASIKRAYRFTYRRYGATGDDHIDHMQLEEKKADWIWIWPAQTFVGRFRNLTVRRDYGYDEEELTAKGLQALEREYRYIPYHIYNDSFEVQDFNIDAAGFAMKVEWRGQPIEFVMPDMGDADNFWKTQVMRQIRKRVRDGEERSFVEEYEKPELADDPSRDLAAKTRFPQEGERRIRKKLKPGEIADGLLIVRWGIHDVEAVVEQIVTELRIDAMIGQAESELAQAYAGIRAPANAQTPRWKQPPEPSHEDTVALLLKLANEDLQSEGLQITADDTERYGDLAPIGVVLTNLATKRAEERAQKGLTDAFFQVTWDGAVDRATFPSHFQRSLPTPRTMAHKLTEKEVLEGKKEDSGAGNMFLDEDTIEESTTEEEDVW